MDNAIIECGINLLSYDRALELAPPEFKIGFDWYQSREGELFSKLPHRDQSIEHPSEITICADRGIHAPNYARLSSRGAGKPRYALAVHSQFNKQYQHGSYDDKDIIFRDDGTWIFDYSGHVPNPTTKAVEAGNQQLKNNLIDGIPVAVLIQQADGRYKNYGLAYVERYNAITNTFTLHGPVSAESNNKSFLSILPMEDLSEEEKDIFKSADEGDRRKRVLVEQIRRERQAEFRKALLSAYDGACAVSGVNIPQVLQAAHIDPYRGKQSQRVSNGVLLRSDIHLLYDSHLLTILPDSNIIKTSESLKNSVYGEMDGRRISLPKSSSLRPNNRLLDQHARIFEITQQRIA